jgi:hypothetical protein
MFAQAALFAHIHQTLLNVETIPSKSKKGPVGINADAPDGHRHAEDRAVIAQPLGLCPG